MMELIRQSVLTDPSPEDLWPVYRQSFPGRRRLTSGPRPMSRASFHTTMTNARILKLRLQDRADDGRTAGLVALANDPRDMPQRVLAPLAEHWPQLLDQGRLWFVLCLMIDPDLQHTGVPTHLTEGIWSQAADRGGVVVVDASRVNDPTMRLPSTLFHHARSFSPRTVLRRIDDDQVWAYEFPAPILV
jgi:ribosomal protein S18 acetylase RimI-like enzyme